MDMKFRTRKQLEEAFGDDNRYFCSKYWGRAVHEQAVLLEYFIRHGGAADFAVRYDAAMSDDNRYYCSKFYGYCVTDAETLWNYYVRNVDGTRKADPAPAELATTC